MIFLICVMDRDDFATPWKTFIWSIPSISLIRLCVVCSFPKAPMAALVLSWLLQISPVLSAEYSILVTSVAGVVDHTEWRKLTVWLSSRTNLEISSFALMYSGFLSMSGGGSIYVIECMNNINWQQSQIDLFSKANRP